MRARIFFWSLTAALAGFLFGFDTVVVSGAEKTIQSLWHLSPGLHGIAMASALYGTVVDSLVGGWPSDRFGRRMTLLWIGVLYLVGAVASALGENNGPRNQRHPAGTDPEEIHRCVIHDWATGTP